MFKRVLIITAVALLVGQVVVVSYRHAPVQGFFGRSEARERAAEFERVIRLINENYVSPDAASYEKLARTAIEAIPKSLDPHSAYLHREAFEAFKADASGEFGGIGIRIEMRDERVTVVAPMDGTPGARAGLMRGDQIEKVDGVDVVGRALDEALRLLRGRPGQRVELTISRPRTGETFDVSIVREIIRVESVSDARMLEGGLGYVRLLQFGERTIRELRQALASLDSQGMRALVLDVRDNPGGLLDAAVEVSELFFNRGELIVYTQGRNPQSRIDVLATSRAPRRDLPVAILINSGSASASEILAGSLRDTGRAVLVGETTFGKGSVQTVYPVPGTGNAIRLTTAYYYLPSGDRINGRGIDPDITVTLSMEEERKLLVQRNRLALMTSEEFFEEFEFEPIDDRQLAAAVDALRGVLAVEAVAALGDAR